ncbi:calcium-binding protein [Microbulbifer sp. SSSA008]|uniref:calcium-binding protein n=1 Tax=Microbulbifer sp. SSSA008 TaxID=3243380 RepID=UPI00403982B9
MITVQNQLTDEQYKELRWDVIRYMEEIGGNISWDPYVDSATPPQTTIGVGFNIQGNPDLKLEIYELLGLDSVADANYIAQLNTAIDRNEIDTLHDIMADRYNATAPEEREGMPNSFIIPHDDLEAAEQRIRNIFDNEAGDPVAPATGTFEARLDTWLGAENLVTSSERVALLSLMYNNVLPTSTNLQTAVRNDERIRAWFEIRYASNPANSGKRDSGLAKRRAYEAALFGLYDDRSKEDQGRDIYNFLNSADPYQGSQRVIDRIIAYENHTGSGNHQLNSWINEGTVRDYDISDSSLVQQVSFQTLFLPIANELAELYATEGLDITDESFDVIQVLVSGASIDNQVVIGLETNSAIQATNISESSNGDDILIATDESGQVLNGGAGSDILIGESGVDSLNGGAGGDVLIGKEGSDNLYGQDGFDTLIGGEGQDTLVGGAGADYLLGGDGGDIYEFGKDDGVDTISDLSTGNTIKLDGGNIPEMTGVSISNKIYENEDGNVRLVRTDEGFIVVYGDASESVSALQVTGFEGDFGITLSNYEEEDVTQPAVDLNSVMVGDSNLGTDEDEDWLEFDHEFRDADSNLQPYFFDASLISTDNPDFPEDFNTASWFFDGGDMNDTLVAGAESFNPRLFGIGGDDTIVIGASGWAWGTGGQGNDYIRLTEGQGHLFGDYHMPQNYEDVRTDDGEGKDTLISESSDFKTLDGGGGNDILIADAGGDGWLMGGSGSDIIQGGMGDEYIYGDGRITLEQTDSGITYSRRLQDTFDSSKEYDDVIDAGEGENFVVGGAGSDIITSGDGDDHIWADIGSTQAFGPNLLPQDVPVDLHGDDVIYAGDGKNLVVAGGGNDVVFGGAEVDWIWGDDPTHDVLESGNDYLNSGAGNDYIQAGDGNDTLIGGADSDVLRGGEGNDTYIFNSGDGLDLIVDDDGENQIIINGVSLKNAQLYQFGALTYGAPLNLSIAYGEGDMLNLSEGALQSSTVIMGGASYDLFDLRNAYIQQWLSRSQTLLETVSESSTDSSTGASETVTEQSSSTFTAQTQVVAAESTSTLTAWYGGQLITIDSNAEGIDPQDPSTWLQQGAKSLTGILTFYTDTEGTIMTGVSDGEGGTLTPAGAVLEYRLTADGSLYTREPDFSDGAEIAPGQNNEEPTGAEGDTSGIDADDEIIDGTFGDDSFSGGEGMDLIRGESGADVIDGGADKDILLGGIGNDTLLGGDGDDSLYGEDGADQLDGGSGNDYLDGGDGDDAIEGGDGNDLLRGGAGNDTLSGGAGSDQYFFGLGDGQDTIDNTGDTGTTTIAFSEEIDSNDIQVIRSGNDLFLKVGDGTDSLTVKDYFLSDATTAAAVDTILFNSGQASWTVDDVKASALIGDDTNNTLQGYNNSDDTLIGGAGDDLLTGGAGQDSLEGGVGDDILQGGSGDDIYLINLNEGADQIVELSGESNKLQFGVDIAVEDVKAIRDGDDLVLSIVDGSSSVTVAGYFGAAGETLSEIVFEDGTSWGLSQVKQLVLTGTDAADIITGYDSDDSLDGGAGDDLLTGNGGNDTYLFSAGDGADQIVTGEQDSTTTETIRFDDTVAEESVDVVRNGDDVILHYGNSDSIIVKDFFVEEGTTASAIDQIEFSTGTVWSVGDLKAKVLLGDGESNTIEAYSSDDLLIGNGGDDTLIGGSGSDTYQFSISDGSDLITDSAGDQDRIDFTDVNPEDVLLRRDGTDLLITNVSTSDTIRVRDQFAIVAGAVSVSGINSIAFADGSVWDYEQIKQSALAGTDEADEIFGHADADTIDAGKGDDTIYGAIGNDIISGGEGADQIYGEDGDDDLYGGEGNDYLDGGSGFSRLYGDTGDDTLIGSGELNGGDGNDTLNGQGSDLLIGGTGNDELKGLAESDVYRFSAGDGVDHIDDQGGDSDRLEFTDVNPEDLVLRRDGNDLVITNSVSGDSIRITDQFSSQAQSVAGSGIDSIVFADSISWNYEEIKQQALLGTDGNDNIYGHADDDTIVAGSGSDTVYGQNGNDVISGAAGQDQLFGGIGNDEIHGGEDADTINGNSGDDQLYGDEGNDVIEDYSGANTIYGGEGNDQLSGNGTLFGDAGADTLTGSGLLDGGEGNDIISGEGSDTLIGGAGDDVISAYSYFGTQNNNILEGGTGNDTLYGSFGDDEYRFNLGDGQDILTERRDGEDWSNIDPSSDSIRFGTGISQADLKFERHGNDMLIAHSNGSDSIRVTDWFSGLTDHHKINEIIFDDGSTLDLAQIESRVITYGTSGDDTLWGYRELSEHLIGGEGDDRYVYYPGGGQDVIDNTGGGEDWLFFNGGIGRDRLSFQREGDDLLILVDEDSEQSVRILNHFLGGDYAIDYVQPNGDDPLSQEFALTGSEINQIVAAGSSDFDAVIEGTSSDDENLQGTSGNDQVNGLEGNDTLFGMAGDDEILGGEGNDYLSGGNGLNSNSGDDVLYGEDGDDILSGEDGDDLLVGGVGDDKYYYGANGGMDTIDNTGGGTDWVLLNDGISRDQLSFHQDGDDLVILVDSDLSQQIRVLNHFQGGDQAISYVQPNDGGYAISAASISDLLESLPGTDDGSGEGSEGDFDSSIEGTGIGEQLVGTSGNDQVKGLAGGDILYGMSGDDELLGGADNDRLIGGNGGNSGSGNDTLYGEDGDDILSGEDGNDLLVGGLGNDQYYYGANGGVDTIDNTGGGTDWILLTDGIAREQLSFHQDGNDLIILVDSDLEQQIRVLGHFEGGDKAISYVQPDDGGYAITAATVSDLLESLPGTDNGGEAGGGEEPDGGFDSVVEGTSSGEQLAGTSGNDQVKGLAGDDILFGMSGDDELHGGADNDRLIGGNGTNNASGDDVLYGEEGDDVLSGEDGNDLLVGGLGDDHYYYGSNGGIDTIDNTGGGTDWILLTDGIGRDQLSFHQDGDDLVILVDADLNQQLRVQGHFLGGDNAISYVQPNDGGYAIPAANIPALLEALPTPDVVASSNFMSTALVEPSQEEVVECDGFEVGVDESSIVTSDSALQADMTDSLVNAMAAFGGEPMGESQFYNGSKDEVETVIACSFQAA